MIIGYMFDDYQNWSISEGVLNVVFGLYFQHLSFKVNTFGLEHLDCYF